MTDSSQRSTEDRLDEIESRFAIADLMARYSEGSDTPDVEVFMSVWHDDAEFLPPDGQQYRGSAAIRASRDPVGRIWKQSNHSPANHTVRFESKDRAVGRAYVSVVCEDWDGRVSFAGGTYHDVYERREGEWKFARRVIDTRYLTKPTDIRLQ
jgi:gamma-hexachlorocyclohexane dehydrochlorinase